MKNLRKKFPILLRRNQGFALIIVLSCLLFITALIVTFLVSMRTEVASSKASADSTQAKQLADMAVNLAIGQIREATVLAGSQKMAWASQPGMIRLYNDQGQPAGYRKLYTWDNMVGTQAFDPFANGEQVPATWSGTPALYTDLNAPITASTGKQVYPIANPEALDSDDDEGKINPVTAVDEFSVTNPPVSNASGANALPMPVKWLYVLADGSVHLPDSATGENATVDAASASNPIIGRVAFWTDDDTCKININTASAASTNTFWSTPSFTSSEEYKLGAFQPAKGEFQRYPGHPATVALNKDVLPAATSMELQQLFSLTPRFQWGGSEDATKNTKANEIVPFAVKSDRLYASVDELLFGGNRATNPLLSNSDLEKFNFFLTSHSRAPELNLFGLPRVNIWPIANFSGDASTNPKLTAVDRLMAFVSTIGKERFFFTRQDQHSTKEATSISRNLSLLSYLDKLTDLNVPGFGGNFATKYDDDKSQILTEIFDYIRITNIYDTSIPLITNRFGFGTDNKYEAHIQVAPTIIKSSINGKTWNTQGHGTIWRVANAAIQFVAVGKGEVPEQAASVPGGSGTPYERPWPVFDTDNTNNLARQVGNRTWKDEYETEADRGQIPASIPITGNNIPPPNTTAVQAFLLLDFINFGQTYINARPNVEVEVTGLEAFSLNGTSLGFAGSGSVILNPGYMGTNIGGAWKMGYIGFNALTYGMVLGTSSGRYPFFSQMIAIPLTGSGPTMSFTGGDITVRVYAPKSVKPFVRGDLIQTSRINIPSGVFPVPKIGPVRLLGGDPRPATSQSADVAEAGKLRNLDSKSLVYPNAIAGGANDGKSWPHSPYDRWNHFGASQIINPTYAHIAAESELGSLHGFSAPVSADKDLLPPTLGFDVIRSVQYSRGDGDLRLLATNDVIDDYSPHPDYNNSGKYLAHNFSTGSVTPFPGASERGKLVNGANYYVANSFPPQSVADSNKLAKAPVLFLQNINGVETKDGAPGDWNNGVSFYPDGPWINKSDEGNQWGGSATGTPYFASGTNDLGDTFFSPNRQMPSPVMFGSLPTGVKRKKGWQTLLFRPGPDKHEGAKSPKDHLLLDLFWMPIVEPYAISEPFSTAGKINMNQQLVPFTYVNRMTGIRAALAAEKVAVMPKSYDTQYKNVGGNATAGYNYETRQALNLSQINGTLRQFREKFATGEIFRSATEICDVYLVPHTKKWTSDIAARNDWYGDDFALVGDNTRERPYAHIYNKVTTKSNTYTVHYRVQALSVPKSQNPKNFNPETGSKVVSDQRGSTAIERYLDPNDPRFLSGTAAAFLATPQNNTDFSLESYYRFHILQSSVFAP